LLRGKVAFATTKRSYAFVVYVQDELLGDVGSILLVELGFPF